MLASQRPDVRCRKIEDADIDAVADCLRRGFPYRRKSYWRRALTRLSQRPAIADFPRFGFLLENAGSVVGVLLMIYSRREDASGESICCNLSSWCVDKAFRGYAPVLHAMAVRRKEVTYLNVSPAAHTRRGIEALGFKRFCDGQMLFAPLLSPRRRNARVVDFSPDAPEAALLPPHERDILAEHTALGCRSMICIEDGEAHPIVIQRRATMHRLLPCQHLIYCRSLAEFVRYAGSIGRHLMWRAWPIFIADANGPTPGLVGVYLADSSPKFFKGRTPPALGNLSYTELAILGP